MANIVISDDPTRVAVTEERTVVYVKDPDVLSYLTTDTTFAGNSDSLVPSQKAVKAYVDAGGGSAAVTSVFGRIGAVAAASNDYTWAQINKATSSLADITTKSHTDLSDIGTNTHAQIDSHISSTSNPHSVTKAQVGLSNVDNTSDANKPVSTATQTALDTKVDENAAITGATKTKITYDAKGLVTSGADATTADIADSSNKRYVTDAQSTVLGNTSGTNSGDVSLTGTPDYITISGQTITRGQVDLAADVTGDLPYANLTASTAASKLLGRGSASSGDWQEITLGTNLSMSGTTLNATGGSGGGDVSSSVVTSVDGEVVIFDSTTGKLIKRGTGSGIAKLTSGVLGVATAGTDYVTDSSTNTLTNKTLTSPTLTTPVLGTPSSGTLTNCTGLPVSGITASTSTALGVGSLELGHASDTTLSRASAGVLAVEGVNVVTVSSTDTLTNKTLTSPTLTTPVLGTPSSGTLTNCTGLPVSGITASTSTALGVGSVELGHASDTTISRVSAGVAAIEGVNILTVAGGTLTGNLTLGENTSIALDPAGSADGKYTGITITGTAGYTQSFGDLVTLDKDDSRWEAVDISVAAAATGDARGIIGVVVSPGTDGTACTILLNGTIRADANFPTLTIGAEVFASTSGDIVVAQPTTTDYVIRRVGWALTADEIYFNPDSFWYTHT